jgi:hypothetical protein
MATKKITDVTTVTSLSGADNLFINQGNTAKQVAAQKLLDLGSAASLAAAKTALQPSITDGVFVMYHRKSDNFPLASPVEGWKAIENTGEIADGVLVIQGGKHLVIAPTESYLYFNSASANVLVNTAVTDRIIAMNDWDGKTKTAALCANAAISADGAGYAPGFCHTYSRTNANGYGLTAGKWWLPSVGELCFIWANKKKINLALAQINGATQLTESAYWSSTEYSSSGAWLLYLSNGYLHSWCTRSSNQYYVRSVSAFIS